MTLPPIVDRELRVRSRQPAFYWLRWALAAIVVALVCTQSQAGFFVGGSPAGAGNTVFTMVAWLTLLVTLAAALLTADCLSSERREGTLGLLFLTDLKGWDVVLGKLAVAGVGASYALLGVAPALMIPVLAGGVTGGEVGRTALVLLDCLFFALAAGLWVSARARDQLRAMRNALLLVAALALVPCLFVGVGTRGGLGGGGDGALLSPLILLGLASDSAYKAAPGNFWLSMLVVNLQGWLLLWRASARLLKIWREENFARSLLQGEPTVPAGQSFSAAEAAASAGWGTVAEEISRLKANPDAALTAGADWPLVADDIFRPLQRSLLLERDPLCWLVERMRRQQAVLGAGALLLFIASVSVWMAPSLVILSGAGDLYLAAVQTAHLLVGLGSSAVFAWAASRFLLEGRRDGGLELLLCTPLGRREVVASQGRALRRMAAIPVMAGLLSPVFFVVFASEVYGGGMSLGAGSWWAIAMWSINRGLEVVAVCWVGMWFGLTARKPMAAVLWTTGLVAGLPRLVLMALGLAASAIVGGVPGRRGGVNYFFMGWNVLLPFLEILKSVLFILWAQKKLHTELQIPPTEWTGVGSALAAGRRRLASAVSKARRWQPERSE